MGNVRSSVTGESPFIAAMAKYMSLTKPQVMTIRNTLMPLANPKRGTIKRSTLMHALKLSTVAVSPDQEVMDRLFTMWDTTGSGNVACAEFIVGISVLACKEDSFEQAIRFALQVADKKRSGKLSSRDANIFLQSICTTASYFGDKLLPSRHIYKVVDSIFETMTLISQDADDMTHAKFVTLLAEQKLVKNVFLVRNEKPKLTNHPSVLRATKKNLHTRPEIDDNSLGKNSLKATSDEDEVKSTQISNDYTDLDSHMSSLMLTPLAKIPISSYLSRERVRKSPTDSSSIMSSIRLTRLTEIPISSHSPVETVKKSQTDSSSIVSSIKLTPLAIIPISSNFTAEPLLRKLSSSQMSSTGLIPFN